MVILFAMIVIANSIVENYFADWTSDYLLEKSLNSLLKIESNLVEFGKVKLVSQRHNFSRPFLIHYWVLPGFGVR